MASTPSGTIFALADRILDGKLEAKLRAWRSETPRASYDEIVLRLRAEDVDVSRETIGRWCRDLDLVNFSPGDEAA
jgi:hypothetical protein